MWKWSFGHSLVVLSKVGDFCKIWKKNAVSLHLILFLAQNFMHAIPKQDNREVLRTNLWSLNKRLGPSFISSWSIQLHSMYLINDLSTSFEPYNSLFSKARHWGQILNLPDKVMNIWSNTFGNSLFQKVLRNYPLQL